MNAQGRGGAQNFMDSDSWRRIGLAASIIVISGNHMLRRPKHSKIEVVSPEGGGGGREDEEDNWHR